MPYSHPQQCGDSGVLEIADFLVFMRRVALRVVLGHLAGPELFKCFPGGAPQLMSDCMVFQDEVETATAAAAVMARVVSHHLVLKQVQRTRERLQTKLAGAIEEVWRRVDSWEQQRQLKEEEEKKLKKLKSKRSEEQKQRDGSPLLGPWLQEMYQQSCAGPTAQQRKAEGVANEEGVMTASVAAQLLLGLVFAGHKNPSIAAAQTVLMLLEDEMKSKFESKKLLKKGTVVANSSSNGSSLAPIYTAMAEGVQLLRSVDGSKVLSSSSGGAATTVARAVKDSSSSDKDSNSSCGSSIGAEESRNTSTSTISSSSSSSSSPVFSSVSEFIARDNTMIACGITEALRLTAHTIGAIRKCVAKEGFTIKVGAVNSVSGTATTATAIGNVTAAATVSDSSEPCAVPTLQSFHIPCGSYIGISHAVPHREPAIWGQDCDIYNPLRRQLCSLAPPLLAALPPQQQKNEEGEEEKSDKKLKTKRNEPSTPPPPLQPLLDEYTLTTFSHGIHKCPAGRTLAPMMLRLMVGVFLGMFDVQTKGRPFMVSTNASANGTSSTGSSSTEKLNPNEASSCSSGMRAMAVGENVITPLNFDRATLAQRSGPCKLYCRVRSTQMYS